MQKKINTLSLLVVCLSPGLNAKDFSVDLLAAVGQSDNALKQKENEIEEQQNRYTLSVEGLWNKSWVDASVQYTAYKETFSDDSQNGENYIQGDSAIKFMNSTDVFQLDLRHSRRNLLKEVGATPLAVNQEERDIFSIMPGVKIDLTASGEMHIFADQTRTRYLASELRNSTRESYGLDYLHDFSTTDKLGLHVKRTESEFIYFPEVDYILESAALVYSVNLRQLSYSIGAGRDVSKPEVGEEFSSPHFEASIQYSSGLNQLGLYFDRSVTDSSYGQGMEFIISDLAGIDTVAGQLELIERKASGVDFVSTAICSRCNLILGVNYAKDKYLESHEEASRLGGSLSFSYRMSVRHQLMLNHSISDQKPLELQSIGNYRQALSRISFRYQPLRNINLDIFAEQERRTSDTQVQDYTENFFGLAIGYHFE